MLNSSTRLFSFQFSSIDGLDAILKNVWIKLHGVPVMAFSEDGLSDIATMLGTSLMLDSYTSDMCMQSWGRSSYARAIIELRANLELKENIVECPKNLGTSETKNLKKPSQTPRGVLVGPNVGFKPAKQVYQPVSKKPTANTSGNKKKNVVPNKEVSKSNSFDVLNLVENDAALGTNGENLWKKVDSSGDYDSDDEVALDDNEMASFLAKNDGYSTNSLVEQWKESHRDYDYDYDPYDDDMHERQEINEKIQSIYDNLDIKVRVRKKK
ncbi:hypothetical protein Tco_1043291 [Tanacetum coccineum]|uniref:DUF4283 domain-containing protein n=1 Tax=Tanacetum coccineum TaxID=301880 RepID=A0ABQ5GLS5_9ASTR